MMSLTPDWTGFVLTPPPFRGRPLGSLLVLVILLGVLPEIGRAATTGTEALEGNTASTTESGNGEVRQLLLASGYEPASINTAAVPSEPEAVTDEVILADGDVIRGRITEENEDEIVLVHPVFSEMRIPRDRIVAIRREAPSRRVAGFGEVITGAGVRPPNSLQSGSQIESATQASSQATTQAPSGEQQPTGEEGEAGASPPPQDPLSAIIEKNNWTFVLGTAFGYVENVNSELNLRLSAQAEHTSEFARLRINSSYFLNSSNDVIVDNDFLLNTTQDWFINKDSNWSLFARGTYQWDAFELWEHRVSGYVGPNFQLVRTPALELDLRLGLGATYEYAIPQTLPEALISAEWSWEVDDRQKINGVISYVPDFTMTDQYRIEFNAEWNFRLQKEKGLSVYLGIRDQFQSVVPQGSTNNDLRMFGGIKYEF